MATSENWSTTFAKRAGLVNGDELASILGLSGSADLINFSGGFPDPNLYPARKLAEFSSEILETQAPTALQYAPVVGLPGLRDFLIQRLTGQLGISVSDKSLLISSGGIEALELICRSLIDPRDEIWVEAPTYLGAITAFLGYEANIVGFGLEDDGLDTNALEDALRDGRRPKFLYVIPDHQNPSGVLMSSEKRTHLIQLARHYGFLIIEDVAYRELLFSGNTLPSLASLDQDHVIQIGTFSKTFTPGFRLGWALGPSPIIAQLATAKGNSDQCASAFGQLLLEHYGRTGVMDETLVSARAHYRQQAMEMGRALELHVPDIAHWVTPTGGFFYWLTFPEGVDTTAIKPVALDAGVAYVPGKPFYSDGLGATSLRLSYSRVRQEDISLGIERLAQVVRGALNHQSNQQERERELL